MARTSSWDKVLQLVVEEVRILLTVLIVENGSFVAAKCRTWACRWSTGSFVKSCVDCGMVESSIDFNMQRGGFVDLVERKRLAM